MNIQLHFLKIFISKISCLIYHLLSGNGIIYGMHYCLNFVCEAEGFPSAVLIRAVQVIEPNFLELDGPGKVCKNLKIDKSFNKTNIFIEKKIEVFDVANKVKYLKLPRVGISKNKEALLRFKIIK